MSTNNLDNFLKQFQYSITRHATTAMQMTVDRIRDTAKEEHEYDDRSGNLTANTISKPVEVRGNLIIGTVANGSEIALYIHEGTGLHGPKKAMYEIRPKDAKALAWETPAGAGGDLSGAAGELIFSKRVKHPGIAPDPFLQNAIHKEQPFFNRQMAGALKLAAREASAGT